jgi:ferredoxin
VAKFKIKIAETDGHFECDNAQSVLEGMMRSGNQAEAVCKAIPVGCRGGGCGVCKVEVISGEFNHKMMSRSHISEEDQACGRVLACRISPISDIELRVIGGIKRALMAQESRKEH